jgi:hypothetical protein
MNEAISLAVTFVAIMIVYEYLKPKDDNKSTDKDED